MKALCILTAFNEIKFLPLKAAYCQANDLTLYVIDNMSTDGTWEYMQKHGIHGHRFDTGEAFDLPTLQREIERTVHQLRPEWVIYNGADLFPVIRFAPLWHYLQVCDSYGYNCIEMYVITFCNTGEPRDPFKPFHTYRYFEGFKHLRMIHRYHPAFTYDADNVNIPGASPYRVPVSDGVMINYGQTKTAEERAETLERRRKAWAKGMNPHNGSHYIEGERRGWVWDPRTLTNVDDTSFLPMIEKLRAL